jgi:hypothetical protein
MKKSQHPILFAGLLICLLSSVTTAHAGWFGSLSEWFESNLIDPEDEMLDASDYLSGAVGFFPIPIIITEPAVGFGLGAAVTYFHPPKELDATVHEHHGPPSISVGFAARTDNGTYLYGGAHSGVWKDDHVRYLGAVAKASVNLRFYPTRGLQEDADDGIGFKIDGLPGPAGSRGWPGSDLDDQLALVAPVEQHQQGIGKGLDALYDVFA